MTKFLRTAIGAIPAIVSLFRKNTPEEGKGIVKSGVASLTISGLISSGRMSAGEIDSTLLIVLAILETAGYLYGLIAVSSGASQTYPEEDLLEGKGDGLTPEEAKLLGREWIRKRQQKQLKDFELGSIRKPEARDLPGF